MFYCEKIFCAGFLNSVILGHDKINHKLGSFATTQFQVRSGVDREKKKEDRHRGGRGTLSQSSFRPDVLEGEKECQSGGRFRLGSVEGHDTSYISLNRMKLYPFCIVPNHCNTSHEIIFHSPLDVDPPFTYRNPPWP